MYIFGSSTTIEAAHHAQVFQAMLAELHKQNAIGKYLPLMCKHNASLFIENPATFTNGV
jgi:hypothetical protein